MNTKTDNLQAELDHMQPLEAVLFRAGRLPVIEQAVRYAKDDTELMKDRYWWYSIVNDAMRKIYDWGIPGGTRPKVYALIEKIALRDLEWDIRTMQPAFRASVVQQGE